MNVVGIDLGTTNSVVAYVDDAGLAHAIAAESGERVVPSVVWFPKDDEAAVEVGSVAKARAVIEPDRVAMLFKRGMGGATHRDDGQPFVVRGKTWRPEELSSLIVKKMAQIASAHLGAPVVDVVITVPAYFGEAERAATRQAGEMLGLTVHALPAEPMAAAVAHGMDSATGPGRFLVFDLGGGTFDVTVLERHPDGQLEAKSHYGDRRLGGADFDRAIVGMISDFAHHKHGVDISADPQDLADAYAQAEEMKKTLSSRDQAQARMIAGGKRIDFDLTRAELEEALAPYVERVQMAVETAIEEIDLPASAIDAVLMVGGSSRMPVFQRVLTKMFPDADLLHSKNLDEDVARGAALIGALKTSTAPPNSPLASLPAPIDRSSHAIGVVAVTDEGLEENVVVLPANTPIPTPSPVERMFSVFREGQDRLELVVNEGDDTDLRFVDRLGNAVGELGGAKPKGYPIAVRMSLDGDGILRATAHDGMNGAQITEVTVRRQGAMSAQERVSAESALEDVIVL